MEISLKIVKYQIYSSGNSLVAMEDYGSHVPFIDDLP
jgi:hypothetical protein